MRTESARRHENVAAFWHFGAIGSLAGRIGNHDAFLVLWTIELLARIVTFARDATVHIRPESVVARRCAPGRLASRAGYGVR